MVSKGKSEIQELSEFIRDHMATKEDIQDLNHGLHGLKGDIIHLSEQVTSIESELRGMKYVKLQDRVSTLEEKVFGHATE